MKLKNLNFIFIFLSLICFNSKASNICDEFLLEHSASLIKPNQIQQNSVPPPSILRFAYLNIDGGPKMWFESQLMTSDDGQWVWSLSPNEFQRDSYYNINGPRFAQSMWLPQFIKEINQKQSTLYQAQNALDFVYNVFSEELETRDVFSDDFLNQLRNEDQSRTETATAFWVLKDSNENPVAAWGLYKKDDVGMDEHMYTKTEIKSRPKFELIRLAINKNIPFSIKEAMTFVSEYLESISTTKGILEIRTDKAGARLYKKLGAQIITEYEEGKFLLYVTIETFIKIFPAPKIKNGSRSIYSSTMFDEVYFY